MTVFRIGKARYIRDLSGEGARLYGGRWNKKGAAVVYTAENRSLATVEYLVHVPISLLPRDLFIAAITIPDDTHYEQISVVDLPDDWATHPAPFSLAALGEAWLRRNETVLLKVPSAVVRGEWNFLINPKHESFKGIAITTVEPYRFDVRLLKNSDSTRGSLRAL